MGTHRSLQSTRDAAEKEERGGGTDGASELPNWRKVEEEEKRRGRWGVPALGGAGGGEGEARASPAGPIYRPTSRCPDGEIFLMVVLI